MVNLSEKELERHIIQDMPEISVGQLSIIEEQYTVDSGVIDILAETNRYIVVIELKIDSCSSSVVAQTLGYLHDIDKEFEKDAIAIILSDDFPERIWKSKQYIDELQLYSYDLSLNVSRYC